MPKVVTVIREKKIHAPFSANLLILQPTSAVVSVSRGRAMGCCESRHDPSLASASRPDGFRGGMEEGGGSIQAVERAAEAIRQAGGGGVKGKKPWRV